ncbi:MAG: DUF61 family protein [Dehalococcoidia bacterium]|nr:DUF61 family protein [Dehalococcoidia bacterium]
MHPDTSREPVETAYDSLLQGWLSGEMRLVNSGLPRERRALSELLEANQPSIGCSDGSQHLFKRAELKLLSDILDDDERKSLLLPILIEMCGDESEAIVLCPSDVERKVVSYVVGMDLTCDRPGRLRLYRPQLSLLRKKLKTTTQYAFSARTGD